MVEKEANKSGKGPRKKTFLFSKEASKLYFPNTDNKET